MKTCTKCKKTKALGEFYKQRAKKDGLQMYCKSCTKDVNKKYKEQYTATPEGRAKFKEWMFTNKEHRQAYMSKWKKDNADRNRSYERKRRAMKVNLEENFTPEDEKFIYMLFSDMCFKCNSIQELSVDHHYPLSKGNKLELDNAVVLCKSCNSQKYKSRPEDFYTEAELQKLTHIHRWTYAL